MKTAKQKQPSGFTGLIKRTRGAVLSWTSPAQRANALLVQAGFKLIGKADFSDEKQVKAEIESLLQYDILTAAHGIIYLVNTYLRAIGEPEWTIPIDGYTEYLNWFETNIVGLFFHGDLDAFKYWQGLRDITIDHGDPKNPPEIIPFSKPEKYDTITAEFDDRERFAIHTFTNELRKHIRYFLSLTRPEDVIPQPILVQQPQYFGPGGYGMGQDRELEGQIDEYGQRTTTTS